MMAFDSPHNGTFTAAQIKISGNYVELELARILRDTIGNGWNDRQMSLIAVLGSIRLEQENGIKIPSELVSEMEDGLMANFNKTRPIIRKDIQELVDDGLLEKPFMVGSKRDKTLQMSDSGYAIWREYNERRAVLFIAAGKTIEKLGGIPSVWISTIKNMIKRFFKGSTGLAVITMLIAGGTTLVPTHVQAWELANNFAEKSSTIEALINYDYSTIPAAQAAVWNGEQDPMSLRQNVDAASFLEQYLPKGTVMNAWDANVPVYQASPAIDAWTDYEHGTIPAAQAAVWNGEQDPMSLRQDIDAASFLEQYLPKEAEMNAWGRNAVVYQTIPISWGM